MAASVGPEQLAELYRERRLEDVDFLGANAGQLRELRQAVRPLARKLAARAAQKRRLRRRGRLDVRRTVRRSLSSGGVPVDPAFRVVRASKPDLYVLADVSGSVIEFAKFTLSLLHAMNQEFAKLRSFAFVDGIDEVTGLLDEGGHRMDLRGAFARAKLVADDGHSHYGNVFRRFAERYGGDIDARSTVIVMGDARNNYREPGLAAFRELAERPAASTGSTRSQGRLGHDRLDHLGLWSCLRPRVRGPHAAPADRVRGRDHLTRREGPCTC